MRGRRNHYLGATQKTAGIQVSREQFEGWVCYCMWVYLLQGHPITLRARSNGAASLTADRVRQQFRYIEGTHFSEDGRQARRIFDRNWRKWPYVYLDALKFVLENNLYGCFAKPRWEIKRKRAVIELMIPIEDLSPVSLLALE